MWDRLFRPDMEFRPWALSKCDSLLENARFQLLVSAGGNSLPLVHLKNSKHQPDARKDEPIRNPCSQERVVPFPSAPPGGLQLLYQLARALSTNLLGITISVQGVKSANSTGNVIMLYYGHQGMSVCFRIAAVVHLWPYCMAFLTALVPLLDL